MGGMRNAYSLLGKLKVRVLLEDIGVAVRIILEWILGKLSEKVWTGFI